MRIDLIHGDCLEEMKNIPDGSVDLVLTDPPYGTVDGKGKVNKKGSKIKDFNPGEWDQHLPLEYLREGIRVLRGGCWFVVFTDKLSVKTVWDELERCGGHPKQTFYWVKTNPPPQPRKNFCSAVETAVVGTKGAVKNWNTGGWNPNYFTHPIVGGKERTAHPTQKPLKLFELLIEKLSFEGQTIIDPFMGSGTTGVACKNLNRNFIGIELDKDYYEIAKQRIAGEN